MSLVNRCIDHLAILVSSGLWLRPWPLKHDQVIEARPRRVVIAMWNFTNESRYRNRLRAAFAEKRGQRGLSVRIGVVDNPWAVRIAPRQKTARSEEQSGSDANAFRKRAPLRREVDIGRYRRKDGRRSEFIPSGDRHQDRTRRWVSGRCARQFRGEDSMRRALSRRVGMRTFVRVHRHLDCVPQSYRDCASTTTGKEYLCTSDTLRLTAAIRKSTLTTPTVVTRRDPYLSSMQH